MAEQITERHKAKIRDKVTRSWRMPPGTQPGFSCIVRVRLIPGGEVISAKVVKSCGSPQLDGSVEVAVLKASPLPVPDGELFDQHFREFNFRFAPQA